jgi:hypothetical protein
MSLAFVLIITAAGAEIHAVGSKCLKSPCRIAKGGGRVNVKAASQSFTV